jgi:dTDP-4-amino-4,6-dideoxygalactose transaminase
MSDSKPAALGGTPAFPEGLSLVRPTIPDIPGVAVRLQRVLESGYLTNGPTVRELEERVQEYLQVPHVVAVSSCTAGLMLTYQALGVRGPVVMPSMTFAASAHAVVWAGGTPRFADVDPERITLPPTEVVALIDGAAAVSATHVYGAPAEVEALQEIADHAGVPVVYDAAHALGSLRRGRPVGSFGTAAVFSMSPTKVATAGEGGLVATHDGDLAAQLRIGRDYGNPGTYDCQFPGLNARMSELHATVALASLDGLDDCIAYRNELVEAFKKAVADLPGLGFQRVDAEDVSSYKDLTLILEPATFGLTSGQLQRALKAEGIDSRRYYHPPIHRQQAYAHLPLDRQLPVTDGLADRLLTPPLYSHMTVEQVLGVADAVRGIHAHGAAVVAALGDAS